MAEKKLRQSLKIKKSSWDPRIPATLICQLYTASQIRQKTKENISTKDKKVLQATVLNSFFQYCRKEQFRSRQKSHHHSSIIWSKKGVSQQNHKPKWIISSLEPEVSEPGFLPRSTSINLKIQTSIFIPPYHPLPPRCSWIQFIHFYLSYPLYSISSPSTIHQFPLLLH